MFLQCLAQFGDKFHLKLIYVHLTRREAEFTHFSHCRIGVLPDANDQAKA